MYYDPQIDTSERDKRLDELAQAAWENGGFDAQEFIDEYLSQDKEELELIESMSPNNPMRAQNAAAWVLDNLQKYEADFIESWIEKNSDRDDDDLFGGRHD